MSETPDMAQSPLSEQAQVAYDVLCEIVQGMGFPAPVTITVQETSEQIVLDLRSDEPMGQLIGKGGQTLNALELLVKQIIQHKTREHGKFIMIDAEGYRERQQARLREMTHEAAREVLETGESVALEPMSPRDRRTIHTAAAEIDGVQTYSEDDEPYRHVVICLAGQKPAWAME